jgi:hypothetical protein
VPLGPHSRREPPEGEKQSAMALTKRRKRTKNQVRAGNANSGATTPLKTPITGNTYFWRNAQITNDRSASKLQDSEQLINSHLMVRGYTLQNRLQRPDLYWAVIWNGLVVLTVPGW